MKEKPLILTLEETKESIIKNINNICNENKISYYFLEIVLKDIYQEIRVRKDEEIKKVKENYQIKQKEIQPLKESDK